MKNSEYLNMLLERQRILSIVALQLSEINDFRGKSQVLIDLIAPLSRSESVHTYRLDEQKDRYMIVSSWYANEQFALGCSVYSHSMPTEDLSESLYARLYGGEVVFYDNKLVPVTLTDWARSSIIFGFTALDKLQGILVFTTSRDEGWDDLTVEWLRTVASMVSSSIRRTFIYDKLVKEVEWRDKIYPIIAHDLRGGIGTLRMLAESAMMADSCDDSREIMTMISKDASDSFMLLDNLLKWSRSRMSVSHVSKDQVEIISLISNNINNFVQTANLKGVELKFEHNCGRYTLEIDEEMIRTVVRNLISNALKFTPTGGVIAISANETDDKIEIAVTDNGVGMSGEIVKTLLSGSNHVTTYGTAGEKGSGLGMSLVREFIALNGGTLNIESHIGQGSRFSFIL